MYTYKNFKEKEDKLLNYLRQNPRATYQQIKKDIGIKAERIYPKNCIKTAYIKAGIPFSKPLLKRNRQQQIKEVIEFIRKNPICTVIEIQNATKVSVPKVFGKIINAYDLAGITYPRSRENIKKEIIEFIKKNPNATSADIGKRFRISVYRHFKNMRNLYKQANIKPITGHKKYSIKKQDKIVRYIKDHPNTTQFEINKECKTHVQEVFDGGIIEAYNKAGVIYPKERRIKYGAAKKDIRDRALKFEYEIIDLLKNFGEVKKYFRTKNGGIADALVKIKDKNYLIEIKDYQSKSISFSEIKQLNNYIINTDNCNNGLLICNSKSKKDKFYIGKNKILVITKEDLLHGGVV